MYPHLSQKNPKLVNRPIQPRPFYNGDPAIMHPAFSPNSIPRMIPHSQQQQVPTPLQQQQQQQQPFDASKQSPIYYGYHHHNQYPSNHSKSKL